MARHNSNAGVKAKLRAMMTDRLPSGARVVFESHAGPGTMRSACWSSSSCWSFDIDKRSPDALHVDSRLVLKDKSLPWHLVDVYDIDPFGNPWEWVWLASRRVPDSRRVGIAITDGVSSGNGRLHSSVATHGYGKQWFDATSMLPTDKPSHAEEHIELFARQALTAWFGRVVWFAASENAVKTTCRYYAAVVEKVSK